jgi:hypothetical protein
MYMTEDFFTYLEQLELLGFFAGFPVLYALVTVFSGNPVFRKRLRVDPAGALSVTYAIVGTLYLGMQLRILYLNAQTSGYQFTGYFSLLRIWALLSVLFWLPFLRKRPGLALVHSLVFFLLLARDLVVHLLRFSDGQATIRTEMKVYTDSLLLNLGIYALVLAGWLLLRRFNKKRSP